MTDLDLPKFRALIEVFMENEDLVRKAYLKVSYRKTPIPNMENSKARTPSFRIGQLTSGKTLT